MKGNVIKGDAAVQKMEKQFQQEFGKLNFHSDRAETLPGAYVTFDNQKSHPSEPVIQLRGVITLPDGRPSEAICLLQKNAPLEKFQQAFNLITLACLRRLSRYYNEKEPA